MAPSFLSDAAFILSLFLSKGWVGEREVWVAVPPKAGIARFLALFLAGTMRFALFLAPADLFWSSVYNLNFRGHHGVVHVYSLRTL